MGRPSFVAGSVVIALAFMFGAGCGRGAVSPEWEIAVENRSDSAVDVAVTHGIKTASGQSQGSANVGNLSKGKPASMLVGPGKTVVKTVKVTQNGKAQELTPEAEIEPGKKFLIIVGTDGKVSGSVVKR